MKLVYVDVGVFQPYIIDNIKNSMLFDNTDIHVICNREFFSHFKDVYVTLYDQAEFPDNYTEKSSLDKDFRGGFLQHCSRRFFLIRDWMKKYDIQNCAHLENDVPAYINFDQVFNSLDKSKLWAPMTNHCYGVPSIMFINLDVFSRFLDSFDFNKNDMENLGQFLYTNWREFNTLPIYYESIPHRPAFYTQNFNGLIFDASAIGQYLGGVDPRNEAGDTRGFVNKECVLKYDGHKFYWVKQGSLYVPHITRGEFLVPIANLHIHSKNVGNFMADDPKETMLITKLVLNE